MTSVVPSVSVPVPADPKLTTLREYVARDSAPEFVAESVADSIGLPLAPEHAELLHARYHPRRNCVFLWSFDTGSARQLLVSGSLHSSERGAALAERMAGAKVRNGAGSSGLDIPSHAYLSAHRLFLQFFPYDLRLPGLSDSVSSPWASEAFARAGLLRSAEAGMLEASPVSYKPFRRCVIHYEEDGSQSVRRFYGKVFRDQRGEPMVERLRSLAVDLDASRTPWDIVVPKAHFPEQRLLVSEAVEDGSGLARLLRTAPTNDADRRVLLRCVVQIAEGLEAFGSALVCDLGVVSSSAYVEELRRRAAGIADVCLPFSTALTTRLDDLEQQAVELAPEPVGLTHRAFRHNHFIDRQGHLTLLDLDNLCLSGRSANAGIFLAYLDRTAAARPRLRPVVTECCEVFASTALAGGSVTADWLRWHRAVARLKWALRAFFSLRPTWPAIASELIAPVGGSDGVRWSPEEWTTVG